MEKTDCFKRYIALLVTFVLSSLLARADYSGTPVTPTVVTEENYTTYGLTAENYTSYLGWYAITSAEELYGFAEYVNAGNKSVRAFLTTDIVVNSHVLKDDGTLNTGSYQTWTPISSSSQNCFYGSFDGRGHFISGLYVNNPDAASYLGLFGNTMSATIQNVGVVDSYFCGVNKIGAIAAYANACKIQKCYNTSTIVSTKEATESERDLSGDIGGIVGYVAYSALDGYVTSCYNTGRITSNSPNTGGIVGRVYKSTTGDVKKVHISNCYNTGTVIGKYYWTGAIVGRYQQGAEVLSCYYLEGSSAIGTTVMGAAGCATETRASDYSKWYTSCTSEEFATGQVVQLLGTSNGWSQNLATQKTPVLGTEGIHYACRMEHVWGTLCLPFDITVYAATDNWTYYAVTGADANAITVTRVPDGTLAAGTPVLLHLDSGSKVDISASGNFLSAPVQGSSANGLTLAGTFVGQKIDAGYYVANNAFWDATDGAVSIPSYRAYISGTISDAVKAESLSENQLYATSLGETLKGDIDGDTKVTITDVAALIDVLKGEAASNESCDVDGDTDVDKEDLSALIKILLTKEVKKEETYVLPIGGSCKDTDAPIEADVKGQSDLFDTMDM